jgi:RNA polymerase sigma-70 factor (ECF subfamily)
MSENENILAYLKEIAQYDCPDSFRQLYNHYYMRLFQQALYYLNGNPDNAQEVVADVFVALWQGRKVLDKVSEPDSYLFIALKHATARYVGRNTKEKLIRITENLPDAEYRYSDSTDFYIMDEELQNKYKAALNNLPPRCAEVFRLVREERKKYSEVAEMLGISVKTIDNQMNKATKLLYGQLKENLFSIFF